MTRLSCTPPAATRRADSGDVHVPYGAVIGIANQLDPQSAENLKKAADRARSMHDITVMQNEDAAVEAKAKDFEKEHKRRPDAAEEQREPGLGVVGQRGIQRGPRGQRFEYGTELDSRRSSIIVDLLGGTCSFEREPDRHRALTDGGGARLAEPARTSPTAKMPGRLVSSSERSVPPVRTNHSAPGARPRRPARRCRGCAAAVRAR